MQKGDNILTYCLLRSVSVKTTRNGKQYIDASFSIDGVNIDGRKWDIEPGDVYEPGTIVKLSATVDEWAGDLQLNILQMRNFEHNARGGIFGIER